MNKPTEKEDIGYLISKLSDMFSKLVETELGVEQDLVCIVDKLNKIRLNTNEVKQLNKLNKNLQLFCSVLRKQHEDVKKQAQDKFLETLELIPTGEGEQFLSNLHELTERYNPSKKLNPGGE
jgi:hypothetical protein